MEVDAEETHRQRLLLDVVVQNLRDIGATTMDEFLGVPSLLPAGGSPSRQERQELPNKDPCEANSTPPNGGQEAEHSEQKAANSGDVGSASDLKSMPLPSSAESAPLIVEMDEYTRQIEECCMEWRAGRVKPYWLVINEPKFGRTQGCALRIQISRSAAKVYSVETNYPSPTEAKKACAQTAIEQGVLDYIRYSDGQTSPAIKLGPDDGECFTGEPIPPGLEDIQPWSVQAFFEALPRPFPESIGNKSASDINAPAWLNTTIQAARGSRLVSNFIWTSDGFHGHGALLRLERPGEIKSWLVAARFVRRTDAKAAVCLLAMSEGVGDYIRAIIKEVDDRLTHPMRKSINDILLPTLLTEYRKIRPDANPRFHYETEADACGCTMKIELVARPTPEQVRTYTAPPDYRNRVDAKMAVIALAVEQGVIEFIRFLGQPPPPDYIPLNVHRLNGFGGNQYRKRKNESDWENGNGFFGRKKFKYDRGAQGQQPGTPGLYQPPYHPMAHSQPGAAVGAWGSQGAPPAFSTYPVYPVQTAQPPSYVATYSPFAPGLTTSNDLYQPANAAAATPYVYGAPQPSVPYGTPYTAAPAPTYSLYQSTGYSQPYQPYPPPPPLAQPQPQPQQYSPHITGAPVLYSNPAMAVTPTMLSQPVASPYPTPVPQPGMMQPFATPPVSSLQPSSYHAVQTAMPSPGYASDNFQRDRKTLPKRASGAPKNAPGGSKKILVQSMPKSSVTELYDYCVKESLSAPQFFNEIVTDERGDSKHKVWVIVGKQKYELPVKFNSLSQGQERMAKKVLEQLRS